jgi:hypothetical protein
MEQFRIKMNKPEIILGVSPLWSAFDKQVVSGQDTGIPNKLVSTQTELPVMDYREY